MTLTVAPIALGGRFVLNAALTTPLEPWARLTFPQITRNLVSRLVTLFFLDFWAR